MDNIEKEFLTSEMTVSHLEERKAVMACQEGECVLPISLLPKGIKEGDKIKASFCTLEAERIKREQKAKEILNEILNV